MNSREEFYCLADARSWALHREVSAQLESHPAIVTRASARVAEWLKRPIEHPYANAWRALLALPLAELARELVDRGPTMSTLRQASPFAGSLDSATRWKILKQPELRRREAR